MVEAVTLQRTRSSTLLTIAGLDPSCGAGITADLKTFAAHRFYGVCSATALTVQSTLGVRQVVPLEPGLVTATLRCLADDIKIAGVKIGMLAAAGVVRAVVEFLAQLGLPAHCVVLDPVLRSTSGAPLLDPEGVDLLRRELLPHVGWITPNIDEVAALLNEPRVDAPGLPRQAMRLQSMAGNPQLRIVITGGHLGKPDDYFLEAAKSAGTRAEGLWIEGERVETTSTHGTGCAFSSALLCHSVAGMGGREAVIAAKAYVAIALQNAYPVGKGRGPMHHLFAY